VYYNDLITKKSQLNQFNEFSSLSRPKNEEVTIRETKEAGKRAIQILLIRISANNDGTLKDDLHIAYNVHSQEQTNNRN